MSNDSPRVVMVHHSVENEVVEVQPGVIHTLCNDYPGNVPEIVISSTQPFVPGETPDTCYDEHLVSA